MSTNPAATEAPDNKENDMSASKEDIKQQLENAKLMGRMEADLKNMDASIRELRDSSRELTVSVREVTQMASGMLRVEERVSGMEEKVHQLMDGNVIRGKLKDQSEDIAILKKDLHERRGQTGFLDRTGRLVPLWTAIIGLLLFALISWLGTKGIHIPTTNGAPGAS